MPRIDKASIRAEVRPLVACRGKLGEQLDSCGRKRKARNSCWALQSCLSPESPRRPLEPAVGGFRPFPEEVRGRGELQDWEISSN